MSDPSHAGQTVPSAPSSTQVPLRRIGKRVERALQELRLARGTARGAGFTELVNACDDTFSEVAELEQMVYRTLTAAARAENGALNGEGEARE